MTTYMFKIHKENTMSAVNTLKHLMASMKLTFENDIQQKTKSLSDTRIKYK